MNDKDYMRRLSGGEPLAALLAGNAPWVWARAEVVCDSPYKSKFADGDEPGRRLRQRLGNAAQQCRSYYLVCSRHHCPARVGL